MAARTIDQYIEEFPAGTQKKLREIRAIIKSALPVRATEKISYRMPTFDVQGKHAVFFAGFKHHIGLYALPRAMNAFADELKDYKTGKGSIQFPLDKPLPEALISKMVKFRVREIEEEAARREKK